MTTARDLTNRLADLLRLERTALADFLVAVAEFDRRRVWLELGHSSLFYFLHRELGLSKGAAFYRKTAAELIQRCPEVIEPLRDGRLCLTSVVELSKVLTAENRAEVLPRFFQLSKREAKEVSAALLPAATLPHRDVVTAVRAPAPALALAAAAPKPDPAQLVVHPANQLGSPRADAFANESAPAARSPAPPRTAPSVEPLTADASRFHVTVSRSFLRKLEAARAALSHAKPGASAQEILEAGLDLLLERHAKRNGLVKKPRKVAPSAKPEHVPAHVRRAVWERDGGRCQWPLESGGICGSTHQVELDHVRPRGRGGPSTIENTRILCRVHNDLAARQVYGDEWMNNFSRCKRGPALAAQRRVPSPPGRPGRIPEM